MAETPRTPTSTAATAAGADHVRLLYHYLDICDIDGCGSLLDAAVRVYRPGVPVGRGCTEVLASGILEAGSTRHYEIDQLVASDDSVVALGRLRPRSGDHHAEQKFADHFTISANGMILSSHRYYFAVPSADPPEN